MTRRESEASVSVRLSPMSPAQFVVYRDLAEETYAQDICASGAMPEPEAREKAEIDFAQLLPDGLDTKDHYFWTAREGDAEVGMVWLGITQKSDGLHAFGYDFMVPEHLRRSGYGRAIMVAAEKLCKERGVISVGLSVFGFNAGAQALYEQMGFEVSAIKMTKTL